MNEDSNLFGDLDPEFTGYMNEVMALYRRVFSTANASTFLVDGTARAGIEACLTSLIDAAYAVYATKAA